MSSTEKTMELTTAEAVALVKRAERLRATFAIHIRGNAPIAGDPDRMFPDGLHTYLNIARKDAMHLAETLLSPTLEARGARISVTERHGYDNRITYWFN